MNSKFFKKLSQRYNTPLKVHQLLKSFSYNQELSKETLRSAYETYKKKQAHCLEAAFLAAAILEHRGYPPMVMSLESLDNLDHVIFIYQNKKTKKWGSLARSRDVGLHGRKPIYKTVRALALSYYEPYVDRTGCVTGYQIAHLDDSKSDWRFSQKNVWKCEKYLIDLKHHQIKYNRNRHKKLKNRYLAGKIIQPEISWLL